VLTCLQAGTVVPAASPLLAPSLLDAAQALLGLAHSCLFRAQTIAAAACPAAAPQLQQLAAAAAAGPLAAAKQQLAAVGSQLMGPAGVQQWGSGDAGQNPGQGLELKAALAAEAALQALQRAASVEGLAAVVSLRLQEVSGRDGCVSVMADSTHSIACSARPLRHLLAAGEGVLS
jgi:hypothetical protein